MYHLFQESLDALETLCIRVQNAVSTATSAVSNGISWTESELKAAKNALFSEAEKDCNITLGQAFEAGANWAAGRVAVAVAQPPAEQGLVNNGSLKFAADATTQPVLAPQTGEPGLGQTPADAAPSSTEPSGEQFAS